MEGCVHRGRWDKKAHVGTILLLMCIFTIQPALLQSSEKECPPGDYLSDKGDCCNKCHKGYKLIDECPAEGQRSSCEVCPDGQYMDEINYSLNCKRCKDCKKHKKEVQVSQCSRKENTICRCMDGYYKSHIDSETYECLKCSKCRTDEKEKQSCTPESDTVCECTENYYKVNRRCEPCKNCSSECKHHCPSPTTMNTKAPDPGHEPLIHIIVGVVAGALVAVVLVVVITHMVTKWSTEKKLLKLSSQPSDVSPDSCEQVLIHNVDFSNNNSVKPSLSNPVSEQEMSNLPDCVPLEIKIPDLIYTVLDLVHVLQVKQLVRSLGVKDIEIEQAELDYRSCREAHYQMLRAWAERGSGRGGMLHQLLLRELLDELRKMGLERAAEELETKYGIQ